MNNVHRAYLASVVCLAGATIQIIYGLLAIPFGPYTEMNAGWDEILWALVNVGFIAAKREQGTSPRVVLHDL
jgi:hypothetical protein